MNNLIKLPCVIAKTTLSRSSVYLEIQKGTFPPPISIGERSVAWVEAEIDLWVEDKISESRNYSSTKEST